MSRGFFVTGTDTGVGKTWISAALLHAFNRQGLKTVAMKPVASGCTQTPAGLRNDDAVLLQQTASVALDYDDINPYAFEPPVAPHLAARQSGIKIEPSRIKSGFDQLLAHGDLAIVEGVGGWQVPVNDDETMADVAGLLGLPVVLVVGMRLGCINHALLTMEAIERSALPVAGWIANVIDPGMAYLDENIDALRERIPALFMGNIPYMQHRVVGEISQIISLP